MKIRINGVEMEVPRHVIDTPAHRDEFFAFLKRAMAEHRKRVEREVREKAGKEASRKYDMPDFFGDMMKGIGGR